MADLYRVGRAVLALVIGCLLGGYATWASADTVPATRVYNAQYRWTNTGCPAGQVTDYQGLLSCALTDLLGRAGVGNLVCDKNPTWSPSAPGTATGWTAANVRAQTGGGTTCGAAAYNSKVLDIYTGWGCPFGGSLSGANCINVPPCTEGQERDPATGMCVDKPQDCDPTATVQRRFLNVSAAGDVCFNSCSVDFSRGTCVKLAQAGTGLDAYYTCVARQTGATCNTPTPPEDVAPDKANDKEDDYADCAAKGGSYGYVNGIGTCLPRGTPGGAETTSGSARTTTTTAADGTTTTTETRTQVTTGTDGTVTATTTTTGGGGSGGGTTTTSETTSGTQGDVCAAQPQLAICRADGTGAGGGVADGAPAGEGEDDKPVSSFGGACGAFSCEGDAIQCAIAREIHTQRCEMNKETPQASLFASASSGSDPGLDALERENREQVDMTAVIDDSGFLGGGCIDDYTVDVPMVGGVTLPFSKLCVYLEFMGAIVVAFSMLAGARIVFV